jgi:CTP:molybdopterin cytidylyltransferase MocA
MADPWVAVLAAGRAARFGGGKLEAICAGKPLGRWALDAVEAAGLEPGLIVTGPEGASFAEGWTSLINPMPEAGLGASLALAARLALTGGRKALLVLLADMPLVTPDYLRELATADAPAATRQADGSAGVPALLSPALLARAMKLGGDRGAAALLGGATLLDAPAGTLRDVDTPEDLAEVERILAANRPPPSASRTPPP